MNSPFSDFMQSEAGHDTATSELEYKGPFVRETEEEGGTFPSNFSEEAIYHFESPDWSKAVRLNERYSKSLGWSKHIYALNEIMLKTTNQSGMSLGPEAFAAAVAVWQGKNGLNPDGVINEITWKKLRNLLAGKTGLPGKIVTAIDPKVIGLINQYSSLIEKYSSQMGINPNLIRGIIAAESGGKHLSGEHGGGYKGLMQADTSSNQLQPDVSIATGVKKFIEFRDKTLNPWFTRLGIAIPAAIDENYLKACLSCYNAGPVTALKAIQYANAAGDWRQWLSPEYYQRALLFSGGYARYEACNKGVSTIEIDNAKAERLKYRFKTKNWRKEPDPGTWSSISPTLHPTMRCWIQTKYRNTPGYLDKFIRYFKYFETNPVMQTVKEWEGYVDHYERDQPQQTDTIETIDTESPWSNYEDEIDMEEMESDEESESMDTYNREREEEMDDESYEAEVVFSDSEEYEDSYSETGDEESEDVISTEEDEDAWRESYEMDLEEDSYETEPEREIATPVNPVTSEIFTKWHNSVKDLVKRFSKEPVYNIDQLPIPSWVNVNAFYQTFLQNHGDDAKIILGDVAKQVMAKYFVLHDTAVAADFTAVRVKDKGIHLWMNAKKPPVLARDWHMNGLGVKLENKRNNSFVHIEITRDKDLQKAVQKKTDKKKVSYEDFMKAGGVRSFGTYYNDKQYELLAYAYLVASLRKGKFLTVTIHREVDRSVVKKKGTGYSFGHDDPQFFDIDYFYGLICKLLAIPLKLGFGIQSERVLAHKQGNMAGYVNEFIPFVTGAAAAANQYGELVRLNPKGSRYKVVKLKYGDYYDATGLKNRLQQPAITKEIENEAPADTVSGSVSAAPPFVSDDTSAPGYTCYVRIDLGKGNIPLDTTGIYVPSSFDAQQPFDLLLYLHGMTGTFPGERSKINDQWNAANLPKYDLRIRQDVNDANKNVILVAPTLGKSPNAYPNNLSGRKGGLDNYIDKVMAAINVYIIQKRFNGSAISPRNIILAAHSAGGRQMRMIATGSNPVYGSKISECWGFDSLYEKPDYWLRWAAANKNKKLFIYFKSSTEANARQLATRAKKIANVFVKSSSAKGHYWVPKEHLRDRISKIGATSLTKTSFELQANGYDNYEAGDEHETDLYVNEENYEQQSEYLTETNWENEDQEMDEAVAEETDLYTQQLGLLDNFAPEDDPVLFYEDVKLKRGETLIGLAAEYGFDPDDWREIWQDPKNAALVTKRKLSTALIEGDIIQFPIKWRIITRKLDPAGTTFQLLAERNGKEGIRLNWVQTVYGHNQGNFTASKPFPEFSVDLPTDDDLPFYWTQREYDHLVNDFEGTLISPKRMKDRPNRPAPTVAMGPTRWRAVTSICVVTNKRVSVWNTFVWGINFNVNGINDKYEIRNATKEEIQGHLNLLRKKTGKSNKTYTEMGWTFRDMNV